MSTSSVFVPEYMLLGPAAPPAPGYEYEYDGTHNHGYATVRVPHSYEYSPALPRTRSSPVPTHSRRGSCGTAN
eukprot:scaffold305339_cov19-Prasinocladus_malaysianus.AAC.2